MMPNTSTDTNIDEDRGLPGLDENKRKANNAVVGIAFLITAVVLIVAVNGGFSSNSVEEEASSQQTQQKQVANTLPPLVTRMPPQIRSSEPPPPPSADSRNNTHNEELTASAPSSPVHQRPASIALPSPPRHPNQQGKVVTPEQRKLKANLLAGSGGAGRGQNRASNNLANGNDDPFDKARRLAEDLMGNQGDIDMPSLVGRGEMSEADSLKAKLEATEVDGARASILKDRTFFLTRGHFLNCALETAISSDVAGMTACRLTRNVYSSDGKIVLLERGTRITGQYQGGLQRGKSRIFVLWTRAESPNGVLINLDSPGTSTLGHSGHDGHINNHFWERFGSAIMLSLVDDLSSYVITKNSDSEIQFDASQKAAQDAASIALENSINIAPTLVKNQGDEISVFVARDLDFRGVYAIEMNE